MRVPVGVEAQQLATNAGRVTNFNLNTKTLSDVKQQVMMEAEGVGVKRYVENGKQFSNGRKNKLKPDIRYKTGKYDYFYETDSLGRITKFETENLQLTERKDRLSHSRNTPGKVKGQDHAGHLVADRFGGSPKIDNLVSQLSDVNLKQYKKIEQEWAVALKEKPPKTVTVDVEIVYTGNDFRPKEFIINYSIDGKSGFKIIEN
ncbi:DNA/RNA non-specific endonuclease [Bacillus carboniphilus]|uniref:DNA/RNA non-specific endonuclease n=1 Tax=Bacillus carboniphilus TaxID=86663 RepID=A0ABY9JTB1_9BACI|nr:DNA/RNA non-specific endonuclease [Bacillus carboniphilus]WLR42626.1 DNA/RNA non-specific endonuclease [Bacillus carboniphilus]